MYDWSGFIELAEQLVKEHPSDETMLRTAVSRAYYGGFNLARRYVEGPLGTPISKTGNAHGEVIRALTGSQSSVNERSAGNVLRQLRDDRRKVDYDDRVAELYRTANYALRNARLVRDRLVPVRPAPGST